MSMLHQGIMTCDSRLTLPLTNLLAAWDARVGVTNVSGACSAWADQSGNGFHATQSASGKRPIISTFGGFASLSFDGSSKVMIAAVTLSSGVKSVYAVIAPTVDSGARIIFGGMTGMLGCGALNTKYQANDGSWRDTGVAYAAGMQRVTYQVSSAGGLLFWKGGTGASPAAWTTNPSSTSIAIGGASGGSLWAYSGHILFLAVYGAARNTAVEAYINQEWGV